MVFQHNKKTSRTEGTKSKRDFTLIHGDLTLKNDEYYQACSNDVGGAFRTQ